MKIYKLKRKQILPISQSEAWDFFSSPTNLNLITPKHMGFKILDSSGGSRLHSGQIIRYTVNVVPGIPVLWVTEITNVDEPVYFVDEQRNGPFSLWQHHHRFKEVEGGVEMTDEVNYAIPFAFIGRLTNWMFVGKKVNAIFDYRFRALEEYYRNGKTKIRKSA